MTVYFEEMKKYSLEIFKDDSIKKIEKEFVYLLNSKSIADDYKISVYERMIIRIFNILEK